MGTTKEYLRYLIMARASLSEIETQRAISINHGFMKESEVITGKLDLVGRLLHGLIKRMETKLNAS